MFCGKRKLYLKDITVKQLIEILKPYEELKVKLSSQDYMYMHFDQNAEYIEFNILDLGRLYGIENKSCGECPRYREGCKCSGKNCICNTLYEAIENGKDPEEKEEDEDKIETLEVEEEEEESTPISYEQIELIKTISDDLANLSAKFKKLYESI